MSRIANAANRYRLEVLARDEQALTELIQLYGPVYQSLSEELDKLTKEIIKLKAANGGKVSENLIYRRTRIATLLQQIEEQVSTYADAAEPKIVEAQTAAIQMAQQHSQALILTALGPIPDGAVIPQNFLRFNPKVVEKFIGRSSKGSPLGDLLASLTTEPVAAVKEVFVKGIVRGENPRQVARELQKQFNVPKNRALAISRTEVLNSYRETSREYYQQNSRVVTRWRWQCAFNRRTCAMCLAMDGREFETDVPMGTHPNCRCALLPITKTWEELGFTTVKGRPSTGRQTGEEWFSKQSEEVQRAILKKEKYRRYKAGELTLRDVVGFEVDPDWGPQRWERSLRQIDAGTFVPSGAEWGIMQGN